MNFSTSIAAIREKDKNPPELHVHGSVWVYTEETEVCLGRAESQGINPTILLLNLTIIEKDGPMKGTLRPFCYEEKGDQVLEYLKVDVRGIENSEEDLLSVDITDA
ncbi:MAG: hypothetical protein OXC18_07665 [Desulfurellaceae bacterium]|nr:hypothetical protein [Desulfurellaceae bacterium]